MMELCDIDYNESWCGVTGYIDGATPDIAPKSGHFVDSVGRKGTLYHCEDESGGIHTFCVFERYRPREGSQSNIVVGSHYHAH